MIVRPGKSSRIFLNSFVPMPRRWYSPLHKEKADVALLLSDAQHADQLVLIKGTIVADSCEIGVVKILSNRELRIV